MASRRAAFAWGAGAFLADRLAKAALVGFFMAPGAPRALAVGPFLDLVMVWNAGVSYGLFAQDSRRGFWILFAVVGAVVGWALWAAWRETRPLARVGLALVAAGGASNLVDRALWGAVADSFSLHWGAWRWYVFNLADAWIVIGVGLFVIDVIVKGRAR